MSNIFDKYMMEAKNQHNRFLNDAGAFQAEGAFADNAMNDGGYNDGGYNDGGYNNMGAQIRANQAKQAAHHAPAPRQSDPYTFTLTNTIATDTAVNLFNSRLNRTLANQGIAATITVTYGFPNYTYLQLLGDTEASPFTCGKIRVDSSSASQLSQSMVFAQNSPNGYYNGEPATILTNLFQQINTGVEYSCNRVIDGSWGINYTILASQAATLRFYPAKTATITHALENRGGITKFGQPVIGAQQRMMLSKG